MARKKLGEYQLGLNTVHVYTDSESSCGSFTTFGRDNQHELTIGLNKRGAWGDVIGITLHELVEHEAVCMGLRFTKDPDFAGGSDGAWFHMNHEQFSEVIARAGIALSNIIPDLAAAYRKHTRPHRKKK